MGGRTELFVDQLEKDKDHSTFFFKRFSVAALISLMVLIFSGMVYTVFLLPRIFYLWDTAWGILLTIKVVIVILVLITGALLRSHKKEKRTEMRFMLF